MKENKYQIQYVIFRNHIALDFLTETGFLHGKPSIYYYPARHD